LSFDASTTLAKSKSIWASFLRVSMVKRTTSLPTSLTTSARVTKLPERFDIFTGSPERSKRTIWTILTSSAGLPASAWTAAWVRRTVPVWSAPQMLTSSSERSSFFR
jgi:hypothetical protein